MPNTSNLLARWERETREVEAKLQTREGQMELLTWLVRHESPRLFGVGAVRDDLTDAGIIAWGIALSDQAIVFRPEDRVVTVFPSVDVATRCYSLLVTNFRLVWADGGSSMPASPETPPLR